MYGKSRKKLSKRGEISIICILALVIVFSSMFAAGIGGEMSTPVSADSIELKVFGRYNDRLVMLIEDSGDLIAFYKDIYGEDSQLTQAEVLKNGRASFLDGGTLGIANYDEEDSVFIVWLYDLETGLWNKNWCRYDYFPGEEDKMVFANVDIETYTMYILSPDGVLWSCETLFDPQETEFEGVTFLDSTPGGWIYVYAEGILFRWTGDGIDSREIYMDAPMPVSLVGESVYVDESGALVRIIDGGLERIEPDIDLDPHACFAAEDYIIAADNSGVIHKYEWAGDELIELETTQADGEVYGIIDDYILIAKDGQVYLTELVFQAEEEPDPDPDPDPDEGDEPTPGPDITPSPEPDSSEPEEPEESTPSPDDEDNEPEEPPTPPPIADNDEVGKLVEKFKFEELTRDNRKYIAMRCRAMISDLRKIYAPQSIEVFTQDGDSVFEGKLKTGMRIRIPLSNGEFEEIPVVIRGDCDGDGKVNESDIVVTSMYIMGVEYIKTDVQFVAMDMNGDGKITTWDLPPIVAEIKNAALK